jgi:hypothetical protein
MENTYTYTVGITPYILPRQMSEPGEPASPSTRESNIVEGIKKARQFARKLARKSPNRYQPDFIGQANLEWIKMVDHYASAPVPDWQGLAHNVLRCRLRGWRIKDIVEPEHQKCTCRYCGGSRAINERDCPNCEGRGYVFREVTVEIDSRAKGTGGERFDWADTLTDASVMPSAFWRERLNAEQAIIRREGRAELLTAVRNALARIPEKQRIMAISAWICDLGQMEIAAGLSVHQSSVSRGLAMAAEILKSSLSPQGIDRYARSRFRTTSLSAEVRNSASRAGDEWGDMCANDRAWEIHRENWASDIQGRAAEWRCRLSDTPIGHARQRETQKSDFFR